jgi:hypothetical protein
MVTIGTKGLDPNLVHQQSNRTCYYRRTPPPLPVPEGEHTVVGTSHAGCWMMCSIVCPRCVTQLSPPRIAISELESFEVTSPVTILNATSDCVESSQTMFLTLIGGGVFENEFLGKNETMQ